MHEIAKRMPGFDASQALLQAQAQLGRPEKVSVFGRRRGFVMMMSVVRKKEDRAQTPFE